eukprot:764690-Hanusia_phi.AAC.8
MAAVPAHEETTAGSDLPCCRPPLTDDHDPQRARKDFRVQRAAVLCKGMILPKECLRPGAEADPPSTAASTWRQGAATAARTGASSAQVELERCC